MILHTVILKRDVGLEELEVLVASSVDSKLSADDIDVDVVDLPTLVETVMVIKDDDEGMMLKTIEQLKMENEEMLLTVTGTSAITAKKYSTH